MVKMIISRVHIVLSVFGVLSIIRATSSTCNAKRMLQMGLSEYEKRLVLDMHNKMRQLLANGQIHGQPPAANMLEMKWDNDLAARAQHWAAACIPGHDPHRQTGRFIMGQNLASFATVRPVTVQPDFYTDAIQPWFEGEFSRYIFGTIRGHGFSNHYTQMIWANTNLVGCGYISYMGTDNYLTKKYVCNYGPGGNVLGQTPYRKGYPECYSFGLTQSRQYPGLCDKSYKPFFQNFYNLIG